MGLEDIFFKNVVFLFNGVPVITLDCSVSETHERESIPTEFEIETGQTISDHVVIKPFGLKIQGIVSNSSLFSVGAIAGAAATTAITKTANNPGVLGTKAAAIAALPLIPDIFNPAATAYDQLMALQAARFPLTVKTSLHFYFNMFIKKISVPRDAKTAASLSFTIDMVQLLLITPVSANLAQFAIADLAAAKANKGAQTAKEASEISAIKAATVSGISTGTL